MCVGLCVVWLHQLGNSDHVNYPRAHVCVIYRMDQTDLILERKLADSRMENNKNSVSEILP